MYIVDKRLLVIGAGGHAKVVIDVARAAGWVPVAVLDPIGAGNQCADVPVLGDDDLAPSLLAEGLRCAVVAIGLNRLRLRIGRNLQELGFHLPSVIHPSAVISPYSAIGDGTVIMPNATVNSHARIGSFAVVNTAAVVEHDCTIGHGAHVAPRTVIGGNVQIGDRVLFGIGAVARPEITIADDAIVGAGTVVVSDLEAGGTFIGTPAKPMAGTSA
jgi:UDP-perosamine 4-acetyltransferase